MPGRGRCHCATFPGILGIHPASAHLEYLPEIDRKAGGWVKLVRCACGQHWQVDVWDKDHVQLAAKIDDPGDWSVTDDKPLRIELLVRLRGGLGSTKCAWDGCTNTALRGHAYCPQCAYEKVGLRG